MPEKRKSSRRDFLRGKAAAEAIVAAADALLGEPPAAPSPSAGPAPETYLINLARRAMACRFEIFLNAGQYDDATETALAALDLIDRLEDQLTVYRDHSEVSRLNRSASEEPIRVETRLFGLLCLATQISAETHGAFDITAGPLSKAWGFTRRAGAIPNAETLAAARRAIDWRWLQLDRGERSVRFLQPGVEINLGSIGKGYALDRCAELLGDAGVHDYLLHGGNSSVLARGSHGQLPDGGWAIGVRNPLRPERRLGEIRLRDRGLATSGSGTQYFMHEGRRYGHLLDPRTGWPAEGVLSATALAPTAAQADALSTAFYVLGPSAAAEYCAARPEVGMILVTPGARRGSLEIRMQGISPDDWRVHDDAPPA